MPPSAAYQPVSSRTYFIVKLTNVLLYTGIIGALVGGLATVPFLWKYGPLVAAGWLSALAGTVFWTALVFLYLYAAMLHLVSPQRLRRVVSYVQFLMPMAMFAPFVLAEADWLPTIANDPPAQLLLLPPTWFASLLPLAAGDWSGTRAAVVLVAFGSIAALLGYVGPRLSLSYAERLGALASTTETRRRPGLGRGFGARWFPVELRVVATLIRGQFRHDMNFRLGVPSILPITILYVFMSLRDGALSDPFVELGYQADGLRMIHFAVLGMPLVLMEHLFRSESFRASWVFFATPVDHAKLVSNAGNFVTIFFLVPYLTTVAAIFVWTFGNILHALGHALVLGLLAHLAIQMLLLVRPRIPFSEPPRKGARMGAFMGVVLLAFLIAGLLPLLLWVAYARTELTIAAVVLLAGVGALMPRLVTRRIRTRVGKLEFTG